MTNGIKFEDLGDAALCCPKCEGFNLHQTDIEVAVRDCEDGNGTAVHVSGMRPFAYSVPFAVEVQRVPSATIPGRRQVVTLIFVCENCGLDHVEYPLQVMQHKGSTLFAWEAPRAVRRRV